MTFGSTRESAPGVTAPSKSEAPQGAAFSGDDEFRAWFAFYYSDPRPDRLTAAVRYMHDNDYFTRFPDVASVFLSKVIAANAPRVAGWCAEWATLDASSWEVILVSLWFVDTEQSREQIAQNVGRVAADKRGRFASLVTSRPAGTELWDIDVHEPRQINLLWAAYSATGDERYVKHVIDHVRFYEVGSGSQPKPATEQAAVGEAAVLSLANNALQHQIVARLCSEAYASHPDPRTRALMRAMLSVLARMVDGVIVPPTGEPPEESYPAH
jgi:hypothetical protein